MAELPPGLTIDRPHRICGAMPKCRERYELSLLAYACDLIRMAEAEAPSERKQRVADLHIELNQLVIASLRDSLAAEMPPEPLSLTRTPGQPAAEERADILAGPELFAS